MVNRSLFFSHLNCKLELLHCLDSSKNLYHVLTSVLFHLSSSYQLKRNTCPWAPNTACSTWTSPNSPKEQQVLSVCSLQQWRVLAWRNSLISCKLKGCSFGYLINWLCHWGACLEAFRVFPFIVLLQMSQNVKTLCGVPTQYQNCFLYKSKQNVLKIKHWSY